MSRGVPGGDPAGRGDPARRIRVVVVDDHQLFRAGVRVELAGHFEIVGEAAAPADAIAVIGETRPDVVLLDVHLPDGGGLAVLHALGRTSDPPRVLALSVSDAADDVVPMIRAGALGYVTKTIDTAALVEAVGQVAAGDAYFSPRLAAFVLQAFTAPQAVAAAAVAAPPVAAEDPLHTLTPREREVLHHLARGYAYKRIALRLGISARTVESHVGAVLRKLQLSSRHEISHWAATRGLIEDDEHREP
ncbi:MAG TPA: response regulator transcription factor [Solirubrobacteraceae bacterium]|jgi:DNA-binding NarL/FixJ family response regulator|nr:response regulator transcription factor [Solirubrobacteraceae bacterium]